MIRSYFLVDGVLVPRVSGASGPPAAPEAPAADPAPAPEPSGDTDGNLDSAASGMEARLEEGLRGVETDAEGNVIEGRAPSADAQPPAPSAPAPPSTGQTPGEAANPEDMTYRQAAQLRQEQQQYRERWGSYEKAFGHLSDEARAGLLEAAPGLGDDVAMIAGAFGELHPDDRAIIANVARQIATDPAAAAQNMMAIAEQLRGDAPTGTPGGRDDDDLDDGDPRYLTEDALDEKLRSFFDNMQQHQADDRETRRIIDEVTALGYDLESEDLYEQARAESLFSLARRLGGDIQEAHRYLSGQDQQAVDGFVAAKAADADRPQPPGPGGAPQVETPHETLDDGEARMRARLDANLGRP